MSKFNIKKPSNKTINLAGGKAREHSPEMELIVSVLSTFLEDKYYEKGDGRQNRIKKLIKEVKPEFVGKLAVMARNEFHLRSVSHLLVGELSRLHRGDNLVSRVVEKIAERPDDLVEIIAYLGKPIPKQIKKGIRQSLLKFSRYQLAKYKMSDKKVKLVDLFNLTHPNPCLANEEQRKAWKDLIEDKLKSEETWEARLSAGENKEKVWEDMISNGKIGYMALLRNLRNISEQANKETRKNACKIIADEERVKASKQLPFRFYNAYQNVKNQDMLQAISEALEHSLSNVPKFDGKALVAVDSSGSMDGDPIQKASIFAAALVKSNDTDLILYDTNLKEIKFLRNEPVLTLAEKIQKEAMGGGTQTSLVYKYAFERLREGNLKYERIIILSDNESWVEGLGYSSFRYDSVQDYFTAYRKENDCFVYAIDIQGYGTKDIGGNRVFHLAGWSEKMFDFMKWIEKENELVEFINRIEL